MSIWSLCTTYESIKAKYMVCVLKEVRVNASSVYELYAKRKIVEFGYWIRDESEEILNRFSRQISTSYTR